MTSPNLEEFTLRGVSLGGLSVENVTQHSFLQSRQSRGRSFLESLSGRTSTSVSLGSGLNWRDSDLGTKASLSDTSSSGTAQSDTSSEASSQALLEEPINKIIFNDYRFPIYPRDIKRGVGEVIEMRVCFPAHTQGLHLNGFDLHPAHYVLAVEGREMDFGRKMKDHVSAIGSFLDYFLYHYPPFGLHIKVEWENGKMKCYEEARGTSWVWNCKNFLLDELNIGCKDIAIVVSGLNVELADVQFSVDEDGEGGPLELFEQLKDVFMDEDLVRPDPDQHFVLYARLSDQARHKQFELHAKLEFEGGKVQQMRFLKMHTVQTLIDFIVSTKEGINGEDIRVLYKGEDVDPKLTFNAVIKGIHNPRLLKQVQLMFRGFGGGKRPRIVEDKEAVARSVIAKLPRENKHQAPIEMYGEKILSSSGTFFKNAIEKMNRKELDSLNEAWCMTNSNTPEIFMNKLAPHLEPFCALLQQQIDDATEALSCLNMALVSCYSKEFLTSHGTLSHKAFEKLMEERWKVLDEDNRVYEEVERRLRELAIE